MLSCWRLRGTLAAAVYGETTPDEQRRLNAHLEACPRCRERQSAFVALTGALGVSHAELDRDLSPMIMRTVAEMRKGRRTQNVGLAWAGMAVAVTALVVFAMPYLRVQHESVPVVARAAIVTLSPVEQAMDQAGEMADKRDFASAYRILDRAVNTHPDDSAVAEAKCRGADIAFAELHWYAEARDDYEELAKQFPARFRDDPNAVARRDLLAEAQEQDFAALYALDAARRHSADAFAQLEQVVGRYPGTFVASLAARDMAELSLAGAATPDRVKGFMAARDRCKDPVARAQLSMDQNMAFCGELDGIGEKIGEHLGQALCIDLYQTV